MVLSPLVWVVAPVLSLSFTPAFVSHQLLLRYCVVLPLLFFTSLLTAQEDCANGIDDDGDGLIDLNDTEDCSCGLPAVTASLLPNPSLEDFYEGEEGCTSRQPGGLPDATNQANCLVGWQRVSHGTTDSWNAFTFPGAAPSFPAKLPQPLPSGTGVAGFWVGVRDTPGSRYRNGDGSFASNYREYLAACLTEQERLKTGEDYRLTFSLGFMEPQTMRARDDRGDVLLSSPNPVELSLYGVRDCEQLNFGEFYGCPEEAEAAGYELIANVRVSGEVGKWTPATVDFIAQADYAGFAVGGSCADDVHPEGARGYRNYYFIDDLILNKREAFEQVVAGPVSVEGQTICAEQITLRGTAQPEATYQWYQDGVALSGATDRVLDLTPSPSIDGGYQVRISTPQGCAISEAVKIQRPIVYDQFADSVAMCVPGEDVTIYPNTQTGASYTWDDGSTGQSYTVNETGTYYVTVSTACVQRVEQFVVTEDADPTYTFVMDPALPCRGDSVRIHLESNWSIPLMAYFLPSGEAIYAEQGEPIYVVAGETGTIQTIMLSTCGLLFDEVTVPDLGPIPVTATTRDLTCHNATSGRVELATTVKGASFSWTDPQGRELAGGGAAVTAHQTGTYGVALNAPGYCTTERSYTIDDNNDFSLKVSATDATCGDDATAIALPTGGVPPYRVNWYREYDAAPVSRNQAVGRDLGRGAWIVEATDSNDCRLAESLMVRGPEPLRVAATAGYDSCHSATAGHVLINAAGGTLPYVYGLSDGSVLQSGNLLRALPAGVHQVVATDAMGCSSLPLPVTVTLPATFNLDAGEDRQISWGQSVVLDATLEGLEASEGKVRWTSTADFSHPTNAYNPLRIESAPLRSTDYVVSFTTPENCSRTDTVRVTVDSTAQLYAPNVFSPNGDGQNDRFSLYTNTLVTGTIGLTIYDRWGNLVWQQSEAGGTKWDGTYNGVAANSGVYVYTATVSFHDGSRLPIKGSVLLMR